MRPHNIETVSYTHLDVYKRQDEQIAKQNAVITIYDALGHKMQQQAASGQIINTLTINHLPKGVYMLEIVGEQRHVLRFVKQ